MNLDFQLLDEHEQVNITLDEIKLGVSPQLVGFGKTQDARSRPSGGEEGVHVRLGSRRGPREGASGSGRHFRDGDPQRRLLFVSSFFPVHAVVGVCSEAAERIPILLCASCASTVFEREMPAEGRP
jgi:hypothetical protein